MAAQRKLTKPVVLKIGAVVLFVALGTVAVLYSINYPFSASNREKTAETEPADVETDPLSPGDGESAQSLSHVQTVAAVDDYTTTQQRTSQFDPNSPARVSGSQSGSYSAPAESSPAWMLTDDQSTGAFQAQTPQSASGADSTAGSPPLMPATDSQGIDAEALLRDLQTRFPETPRQTDASFGQSDNPGGDLSLPPILSRQADSVSTVPNVPTYPDRSYAPPIDPNSLPRDPNQTRNDGAFPVIQPEFADYEDGQDSRGTASPQGNLAPLRPGQFSVPTQRDSSRTLANSHETPPYSQSQSGYGDDFDSSRSQLHPASMQPQTPTQSIYDNSTPPMAGRGSATPTMAFTTPSDRVAPPVPLTPSAAAPTPGDRTLEGVQAPALSLHKTAPDEIQVNRPATFQLLVKNNGNVPANQVVVRDFIPQGTELLEAVPEPSTIHHEMIQWDLGTLNPGQQTSIKMQLLPKVPGEIGSVAHVSFGALASSRTTCTRPDLVIRHEAPDTVLVGQDVVMQIFVENKGDGAAEQVVLQEDVPEGLEFAEGQRELEYEIGTIPPGQTRNIQLRLKSTKVGRVRNMLIATGAGRLRVVDAVDIRIVAPKLTLGAEGPSRKFLEREATHYFSVANEGTAPATNMHLVARLPRGLRFVGTNNQGQYDPNAHAVAWRLSKLDPDKTGQVELVTMPVATGDQVIEVVATADLNQRQSTQQTLAVSELTELFFDIDDVADPIETGTETSYQVRVVNQGAKTANNVHIVVEFPNALRPLSVEGLLPHQIRGQTVVFQPIDQMDPGQEMAMTIRAQGLAPGDHRVMVSMQNDDRDVPVSKQESTHVYSDR